jgi:hypothetical protein
MTVAKKTLTASLAAISLGGAILATSVPAEAGWGRRGYYGGAVAAAAVGAFALGAIAASSYPAYAEPVYGGCYIQKRKFVNAYGDLVIRRERVCY